MPSHKAASTWAAVALVLTGIVFAALAAWSLVARSTIPLELDGVVTAIELRHEKHPGVDDVWMVAVDNGEPRHLDRDVVALLHEGDRVLKEAWDTTLEIEGEPHKVTLSGDARAMLGFAPAMAVLVGALVAFTGRRSRAFREATRSTDADSTYRASGRESSRRNQEGGEIVE